MAQGTPEQVAAVAGSYTGQFLKPMLDGTAPASKGKAAPRTAARTAPARTTPAGKGAARKNATRSPSARSA